MDPNECLKRWRAALRRDLDEAREAAEDLLEWMNRGGFEPRWEGDERERFTLWCTIEGVPGVGLFEHAG